MKNSVFNNNMKNNGKLDTVKNVGKGIGEGLGVIAIAGLCFLGAVAEAENENRREEYARETLNQLEVDFLNIKADVRSISYSKYPWGYYNGIVSDLNDIEIRYMKVKNVVLRYGVTAKSVSEINDRYGYNYISNLESSIHRLSSRI